MHRWSRLTKIKRAQAFEDPPVILRAYAVNFKDAQVCVRQLVRVRLACLLIQVLSDKAKWCLRLLSLLCSLCALLARTPRLFTRPYSCASSLIRPRSDLALKSTCRQKELHYSIGKYAGADSAAVYVQAFRPGHAQGERCAEPVRHDGESSCRTVRQPSFRFRRQAASLACCVKEELCCQRTGHTDRQNVQLAFLFWLV